MAKTSNNSCKVNSKLKKVLKDLYDMREVGLTKSGEFSTENIVFIATQTSGTNFCWLVLNTPTPYFL